MPDPARKRPRLRTLHHGEQPPVGVEPKRYKNSQGYVRLRWRVSPMEMVECYEHRWVMGNPPRGVDVHHINHVRDDNRPENLKVVTPAEHGIEHRTLDRAAARRLYEQGLNTIEVGEALGYNSATIYRALRDEGVRMRGIAEALRHSEDDLPSDDIRLLHDKGVRSKRIARLYGVAPSVIDHRVREMGLTPFRSGTPTKAEIAAGEAAIGELVASR